MRPPPIERTDEWFLPGVLCIGYGPAHFAQDRSRTFVHAPASVAASSSATTLIDCRPSPAAITETVRFARKMKLSDRCVWAIRP
jgi:hypothetical protein